MAVNDTDRGPLSRGGVAAQPLFAVGAVLLGSFLANFDSRLTSVGLPDLRGAFSLTFDEGAWLSTAGIGSQIFIAPAVAWLATAFGLRRVLGIPSLVFALIALVIPFVRDYPLLIALSIIHGMLLGTFVPATLMIVLRNLPIRWFGNARADNLTDPAFVHRLRKAGCWMLAMGIETESEEISKDMVKKLERVKIQTARNNMRESCTSAGCSGSPCSRVTLPSISSRTKTIFHFPGGIGSAVGLGGCCWALATVPNTINHNVMRGKVYVLLEDFS